MTDKPIISVLMGSKNDLDVMRGASEVLSSFGVPYEVKVISAHRAPDYLYEYVKQLEDRGIRVVIAGAGGAAHLPGVVAALTHVPVIGVPVESKLLGLDSLLSIVQMPSGVPVATVGINNSKNAAFLALRILALQDEKILKNLKEHSKRQAEEIRVLKL